MLETIKCEQVEQKSLLKFSNKSPMQKSTTRFQCAQKHTGRVIYNLNKFPLQKERQMIMDSTLFW